LKHKNVIGMIDFFEEEFEIIIIMELADHGCLEDLLKERVKK
jgi:serine/threonine protein kinase